jgi:hypothetical protein
VKPIRVQQELSVVIMAASLRRVRQTKKNFVAIIHVTAFRNVAMFPMQIVVIQIVMQKEMRRVVPRIRVEAEKFVAVRRMVRVVLRKIFVVRHPIFVQMMKQIL